MKVCLQAAFALLSALSVESRLLRNGGGFFKVSEVASDLAGSAHPDESGSESRVAEADGTIGEDRGLMEGHMMYSPLECNLNASPAITSDECITNAVSLSSLMASATSAGTPTTIPCGTCAYVDYTDGSTVVLPGDGSLNVVGRLHFPSTAHVTLSATAVVVEGHLDIGVPDLGNQVKILVYGSEDVFYYPHDMCTHGDTTCQHRKNVGKKPIVVAGGTIDIRAIDPTCPSWTTLKDVGKSSNVVKRFVVDPDFARCVRPGDELLITTDSFGDTNGWDNHFEWTAEAVDIAAGVIDMVGDASTRVFATEAGPGESIYAAEVALLRRDVIFEGHSIANEAGIIGGHFMIFHTRDVVQTIEGVAFHNFGQDGILGRYPVHFHKCEDSYNSKVSRNVIRNSNQRCILIHGTNGVTVEENVAFQTKGHCFATEDGSEVDNHFLRNLGAAQRMLEFSNGQSDSFEAVGVNDLLHANSLTTYWIRNAQNYFIGNVAAGSKGAGFWFDMVIETSFSPLFKFEDNVAHSCATGLLTYPGRGWTPSNSAVLENTRIYKNSIVGMLIIFGGGFTVKNSIIADNTLQIQDMFQRYDATVVEDTVIIGRSQDAKNRLGALFLGSGEGIRYNYNTYHNPKLRNVTFSEYGGTKKALKQYADTVFGDPIGMRQPLSAIDVTFDSTVTGSARDPLSTETVNTPWTMYLEDPSGTFGPVGKGPGFFVKNTNRLTRFISEPCSLLLPGTSSDTLFCEGSCLRNVLIYPKNCASCTKLLLSDGTKSFEYIRTDSLIQYSDTSRLDTKHFDVLLPPGNYQGTFKNNHNGVVQPSHVDFMWRNPPQRQGCTALSPSSFSFNVLNQPAILSPLPPSNPLAQIPDAADFQLVYSLDIPSRPTYRSSKPRYSYELGVSGFSRVAYYLQLDDSYVWVSMDAFTDDSRKIGVPCLSLECGDGVNPTIIQQIVSNVNVESNVPGLSGSGLDGNVEFWPYNYSPGNFKNIAGASGGTLDFGDTVDLDFQGLLNYYGSMQVHINGGGGYTGTVFAFNRFNDGEAEADLGIGNNPNGDHPDWSLSNNAGAYNIRKLDVYVLGGSAPPPTPAPPTPVPPTPVPPSPTAPVPAPLPTTSGPAPLAIPNIPDSEGFQLVYELDIPTNPNYQFGKPVYSVDNHLDITGFDRVAYYLELDSSYVWVSMDTFTDKSSKIGVPCLSLECGDGVVRTEIQQIVTNVNIDSNVHDLSGSGYSGNVEFWPFNYSPGNYLNIPGASSGTFDSGDTNSGSGNFGSMQVHVHGGGTGYTGTVFAFNRFNDGEVADLGIGDRPTSFTDWSIASNANAYDVRKLKVFVSNVQTTPPLVDPYIANKNIPDAEGFQLVYALDIPTNPNYGVAKPDYSVDNALAVSDFSRIAYYMELDNYWVWVSMDKFTSDARQIGVPCLSLQCGNGVSPTLVQQVVTNVNVKSSIGMLNGSGRLGNVEFWPYNYSPGNALFIPGASGATYDFGDTCDSPNGNYGSMQVHVHGGTGYTGTIFAFNLFNAGAVADVGISNQLSGNPDWSLSFNANIWNNRKLRVYVAP